MLWYYKPEIFIKFDFFGIYEQFEFYALTAEKI